MRKINLGIVLTIIILIVLTCYLVRIEISRDSKKDEIFNKCVEYLENNTKYSMLEEKYRTIDKTISDEEYNRYLNEAKTKLTSYMVATTNIINNKNKVIEDNLNMQIKNSSVITNYTKEGFKPKSYIFNGEYVTVNIESYSKIEVKNKGQKYLDNKGKEIYNITDDKSEEPVIDTITLKKEDNTYKIVYEQIMKPNFKGKVMM